jgi:hypothetical protein
MVVSVVHATAKIVAGALLASFVNRHLGLKFVARGWFNLDVTWLQASFWSARYRCPLV